MRFEDKLWRLAGVLAVTAITYTIAHQQATAWRGYEAVGGELLILILPATAWAVRRTVDDWAAMIKEIWEE